MNVLFATVLLIVSLQPGQPFPPGPGPYEYVGSPGVLYFPEPHQLYPGVPPWVGPIEDYEFSPMTDWFGLGYYDKSLEK
jgi:hypothetical protein